MSCPKAKRHTFYVCVLSSEKHFTSVTKDSASGTSSPSRNKSPGADCLRQNREDEGKRPQDAVLERVMSVSGKPVFSESAYHPFIKVLRTFSFVFPVAEFSVPDFCL